MAKQQIIGTITGVCDGALDGLTARLVSRRQYGYMVELLESTRSFHKGDLVYVSVAEFLLQQEDTVDPPLRTDHLLSSESQ